MDNGGNVSNALWLILLAVPAGVAVWYFKFRKDPLPPEVRARVEAAKAARKSWKAATRQQSSQLKAANQRLEYLKSHTGNRLDSFGGVTLYERWIETPQGGGSLLGVHAEAADESSINKRITATRLVTLGVFALAARKKSGAGNVYVVLEGPSVAGVATMPGDKKSNNGPRAFAFAAKVNNAARAAEQFEQQRPGAISAAEADLSRVGSDSRPAATAAAYRAAVADLPPELQDKFKDLP